MKTYRNEQLKFEIEIPEEWSVESINKVSQGTVEDYSIVFKCGVGEAFNIQIGKSVPGLSLEQTESEFRRYADGGDCFALDTGRIIVQGQEHVWSRYLMGGGIWTKKYLIGREGMDYVMTATCFDQKLLLQHEKVWDEVVVSIRVLNLKTRDVNEILRALAQPAPLSAMPQRIELCEEALTLISLHSNPEMWAGLQLELGNSYSRNPIGNPEENIEKANHHFEKALEVFTRKLYPDEWANIQTNLASNYRNRKSGDRAENIETAIRLCLDALKTFTKHAPLEVVGSAHNNLANAYRNRVQGDRGKNLEEAILHCQNALDVFPQTRYLWKWGTAQNNLGNIYMERVYGDPAENIEQAIHHYEQALRVFSSSNFPEDWAWTHSNLAAAYVNRPRGEATENIEQAIHHGQKALEVFTKQALPEKWAIAQKVLGIAYQLRSHGTHKENLEKAIHHYQMALEVFTQENHPDNWVLLQGLLTNASQEQYHDKTSPQITYPQFYDKESSLYPGQPGILKLIYATIPDYPNLTHLLLYYQWDEKLSKDEAKNLTARAIVYLACAIYDVAINTGLRCQPSPIPNGRRPAWILEGERSPISLILSEVDMENRTCQLTIGAMMTMVGEPSSDRKRWEKMQVGFQIQFSEICV